MLFGKKKNKTEPEKPKVEAKMIVIPDDFYGGKDPVIHYAQGKTKIKSDSVSQASLLKNKKTLIIGGIFLILVFSAGSTWYYINQAKKFQPEPAEKPASDYQIVETKVETDALPLDESTSTDLSLDSLLTEIVPTSTPALERKPLLFPRVNLIDSNDIDNDELTDGEEEIFGTDSGKWDTDGDGYYDGQEVINLYNPTGLAPIKIIDSGLVKEYINPTWQYRVYYPQGWEVGLVDPQGDQVLLSSPTGDFVSIEVFKMEDKQNFESWFAQKAVDQQIGDLQKFTNRFQEAGQKRKDGLVGYFTGEKRVYVIIYHPGDGDFISFRNVVQLIMNSFRPNKTIVDIPDQLPLPPFPDFDKGSAAT